MTFRKLSFLKHPQPTLHNPGTLLCAIDALERETEDEGAIIRALVDDARTIIARGIDEGRIRTSHREQAIRSRYGIALFIHLRREGERGIGTERLARSYAIHASAMSELQGALTQRSG